MSQNKKIKKFKSRNNEIITCVCRNNKNINRNNEIKSRNDAKKVVITR